MFTRLHYKAIAKVFKARTPVVMSSMSVETQRHTEDMLHHHTWLIGQMANMFNADNPQFNYTRFFEACSTEDTQ